MVDMITSVELAVVPTLMASERPTGEMEVEMKDAGLIDKPLVELMNTAETVVVEVVI